MIHYRLEMPEEIEREKLKIMDDFCAADPYGEFVEEEWKAFYSAHASESLKQYDREIEETKALAKREGVLV